MAKLSPRQWAAVVGALTLATGWPFWISHSWLTVIPIGMLVLLALLGGTYLRAVPGRRMGGLFVLAALLQGTAWIMAHEWPFTAVITALTHAPFFALLLAGALMVGHDHFRSRLARFIAYAVLVETVLYTAVPLFLMTPTQVSYPESMWWPNLIDPGPRAAELLGDLTVVLYVITWVSFVIGLATVGASRRIWAPLWVACLSALVVVVGSGMSLVIEAPTDNQLMVQAIQTSAASLIPVWFFAADGIVFWRELDQSRRVLRECNGSTLATLETSLGRIVGDDGLRFLVWLPATGSYIDSAGGLHAAPDDFDPCPRRLEFPVADPTRGPLGYLYPGVWAGHGRVGDQVLTAVRPVLKAVQAELDAHEQVKAAQRRVLAAQDAGRRQMSRDLHDGVQQRLLALAVDLSRARPGWSQERLAALIANSRRQVEDVITEIREISRGVHPPLLVELGLAGALEEAAERLGLIVDLQVDSPRPSPEVESELYYAMSEALTNCSKHAGDQSISVRTRREGDTLVAEVVDQGNGGAVIRLGGGLHGAQDRVRALNGSLVVDSPVGLGTSVTITVPMELSARAQGSPTVVIDPVRAAL